MSIRLYDTMRHRKVDFEPRDEGRVSMYVCGPTVYNHIHIGNARTFLSFDVIRRYLEYVFGEEHVTFVRNITDVDDKIIDRADEEGRSPEQVAREYTDAFHEAMDRLGVRPPDIEPKATETVGDMIAMVERLVEKGYAYEVEGDVYFSVRSFSGYGKLSGRDVDEMRSGSRVRVDERKRDPLDFALWKSAKPGEPSWESPWGPGRPGWHLECSVMSTDNLGESFDIHGGGADLVFPHHENEVAQSEADTGEPFARYWLHGGMLRIDQEKMSKSLGNSLLLEDVLDRFPAPVIRLLMLQTHYRSPLDFSDDRLREAEQAYRAFVGPWTDLWDEEGRDAPVRAADETGPSDDAGLSDAEDLSELREALDSQRRRFREAMDDDFNTPRALAAVFDFLPELNRRLHAGVEWSDEHRALMGEAAETARDLLGVLGIDIVPLEGAMPEGVVDVAADLLGYEGEDVAVAAEALVAARDQARAERDWTKADTIRDRLIGLGVEVQDTPEGTELVPPRR